MANNLLRQVHPALFINGSAIHGKGLFTREAFEPETYLGEYLGSPCYSWEGRFVLKVHFLDGQTENRDGGKRGNLLRYLNHARPANVENRGFEIWTTRRIEAGEELTLDYGPAW